MAWRPLAASILVGAWFFLLLRGVKVLQEWQPALAATRGIALLTVLIGLFVGAPIYLYFAMKFKAVSGDELSRIPFIGKYLVRRTNA